MKRLALLALCLALLAACGHRSALRPLPAAAAAPRAAARSLRFVDVTAAAGIHFLHNTGAFGRKYLPETLGSGVAFMDYNNDGCQDILLLNGEDWPGHPTARHGATMKLYRNNCDGTFTDVTRAAGLAIPMYAMGAAVGDYDNDGYDDLYITTLRGGRLFHNNGNGTFTDVTARSGITNYPFATSAAWLDYDHDGRLDLFVDHYVEWSPATDIRCTLDGVHKSYCTPEAYRGASPRLYHNDGHGHFTEVTKKAGIYDPTSKCLGVAVLDYDNDGWPDIFVSNDTQPNKLYRNNHDGTFTEQAVSSGVAFSEDGVARGGMGTDAADYDGSGRFSLIVGNFSNQMLGLYHNEGHGLFVDVAPSSAVGQASLLSLSFGTFFFDYDLDGTPDLLISTNNGPAYLYLDTGNGNHALRLRTVGVESTRDGIGARVRVEVGGRWQEQRVKSGSSYLSASELPLTFGLGVATRAEAIEIHWPSGIVDRLANVAAGQFITVTEGRGITARQPLHRPGWDWARLKVNVPAPAASVAPASRQR